MTDTTARVRAEEIITYIEGANRATRYGDTRFSAIRRSDDIADQIRQAMAAARQKALEEAAAIAGTLAERPYDSEPEFSCATTIESYIRELMDNPNVS